MSVAYFLELHDQAGNSTPLSGQSIAAFGETAQSIPGLSLIDLFTPLSSHDPFLDDGAGPSLVMQMRFADPARLVEALRSPAFEPLYARLNDHPGHWFQQALRLETYPVSEAGAQPGAVSYLVNYHRPAENEKQFISHYRAHHPPIMARFPKLRSLELGLPIEWQRPWQAAPGIIDAKRMLFCEVSFDSIEDLNAALASEVRKTLREDFSHFPPFSGALTHFAMQRRRLNPH